MGLAALPALQQLKQLTELSLHLGYESHCPLLPLGAHDAAMLGLVCSLAGEGKFPAEEASRWRL